jgi:hypothetical protein
MRIREELIRAGFTSISVEARDLFPKVDECGQNDKSPRHPQGRVHYIAPSRGAVVSDIQADVEFRVVMSPDDLKRAGVDELGKRWS